MYQVLPEQRNSKGEKRKKVTELKMKIETLEYIIEQYKMEIRMYRSTLELFKAGIHTLLLDGNAMFDTLHVNLENGRIITSQMK